MPLQSDWNAPWLNRTFWIFDHLENFQCTPNEALVVLTISFLNDARQDVTPEIIMEKTRLDLEQVDEAIDGLNRAGYLNVKTRNRKLVFSLEGLFEDELTQHHPLNQGLISEFGREFGRPLSGSEMETISRLSDEFEESMVIRALDEAAAYEKRSLMYVEKVLQDWKRKGLSAEDIERGLR